MKTHTNNHKSDIFIRHKQIERGYLFNFYAEIFPYGFIHLYIAMKGSNSKCNEDKIERQTNCEVNCSVTCEVVTCMAGK